MRRVVRHAGRLVVECVRREGRRGWGSRLAVLIFAVVLASRLSGVGSAQDATSPPIGPDPTVEYVGVVEGTDIYVAVLDRGAGMVDFYFCDGTDVILWLQGSGDAGTGTFAATAEDGTKATGTFANGVASGTFTLAGGPAQAFTAGKAILPAGLYTRIVFVDEQPFVVRTIVLSDQTARGAVGKAFDCNKAESNFDFYMDKYNKASVYAVRVTWGNLAHSEYVAAMNAGCSWAPNPTT
jgi:hypothetical protein